MKQAPVARLARRKSAVLLAVGLGALAAPSFAQAAFVSLDPQRTTPPFTGGTHLSVFDDAENGEKNTMVVRPAGGNSVAVADSTAPVTAGNKCRNTTPNEVVCDPSGPLTSLRVSLGKGDDSLTVDIGLSREPTPQGAEFDEDSEPETSLSGGDGNDTIIGSNDAITKDIIQGGDGNDNLQGRIGDDGLFEYGFERRPDAPPPPADEPLPNSGNDSLDGGPGDDTLDGGFGTDTIVGGNGIDFVNYSARRSDVRVDLNAGPNNAPSTGNGAANENDSISGVEDVEGGRGNDTLIGDGLPNDLDGNAGNDTLTGNLGSDRLTGDDGDDTFLARDLLQDLVLCGTGADKGEVDNIDVLSDTCANKALAVQAVPGPPDKTKPKVRVRKVKNKMKRKKFFKSGVAGTVVTDEETNVTAELLAGFKPRKGAVAAKVGDLVVSSKSLRKVGTTGKKFRLKVKKKYRRAFPRRFKLKLRLTATDAAGNRTTKTVRIRVR